MADSNLGPAASWHIRSIPESVRKAFVKRASDEEISVGELLTRMVVNAGDMVDAQAVARGDAHVAHRMVDAVDHAVDADRLLALLKAAEMADRVNLSVRTKGAARAIIAAEIRSMRKGQMPPRRTQAALAGPEDAEHG